MPSMYVAIKDWDAMLRDNWDLKIMYEGQTLTQIEVMEFCNHFLGYRDLIDKRNDELVKYKDFFRVMKDLLAIHELDELKEENKTLNEEIKRTNRNLAQHKLSSRRWR